MMLLCLYHAFHITDGAEWLGKLLSCFVTERKHRLIKRAALYVFRHMEHTVLVDVINTMFQQIEHGADLYRACFLVSPRLVEFQGVRLYRSGAAVLRIGHVARGDLIITNTGVVAKIVTFMRKDSVECLLDIFAEVDVYPCVNGDLKYASSARSTRRFLDCKTFVDCLIWLEESPGLIRISIPPALLFK